MSDPSDPLKAAMEWVPCGSHVEREPAECYYCAIDELADWNKELQAEIENEWKVKLAGSERDYNRCFKELEATQSRAEEAMSKCEDAQGKLVKAEAELARVVSQFDILREKHNEQTGRANKAEARVKELERQLETNREHTADVIKERDVALIQWHSHQKNVPCRGCKGGHDTFWKSVVESPQWKAWEESLPDWDVDECRECGHISAAHFAAFVGFVVGKADIARLQSPPKSEPSQERKP